MYTAKRWPHGRIPYIMESKFDPEERAAVARGIMILQERTCIRFVPKKPHDSDYVLMKRGPGCAAHVGRIGGQQCVILGDGYYGIETVTHELMHAVGFIHGKLASVVQQKIIDRLILSKNNRVQTGTSMSKSCGITSKPVSRPCTTVVRL